MLVLAVLTVSYASSMRAYLEQRAHIGDLKAQARARFGYLMPGEAGFEVIGADGKPLEAQASLNDPSDVIKTVPTAWWTSAWESIELAGNPPPPEEEPVDLVDGTKQ